MEDIKVSFPGEMKVDAEYKGFTVRTDQPAYAGGEGSALAPFDLFLISIAACAGYYVLAFCKERGISLGKASLVVKMEKNPESKMIRKILIAINLPTEFPARYKNAIIKAVDSCPVKAHILNPPEFQIEAHISQ